MIPPTSALVIVTRRIGDVLLTTPLIRSIKQAWPHAAVDVLLFAGTESVLAANPDVRNIITIRERPRWREHLQLVGRIVRRYDIALSVVPSDRPTVYAWLAGRWRAGLVLEGPKHRWKTWLLQRSIAFDNFNTHTVLMHLKLAQVLGISSCYQVSVPWRDSDRAQLEQLLPFTLSEPYAVLHPYPKFNYKMWRPEAWVEVARWLQVQGCKIVFSGSADPTEVAYVAAIAREIDGVNLAGKISLSHVACLLSHSRVYAGPDTAVTHMAAASGVPTVALYGPSDPIKWGPWPANYGKPINPWQRLGTQHSNNVTLIQGRAMCAPCRLEGCDRRIQSFSDCLQTLSTRTVIDALAAALKDTTGGERQKIA